jgi:molybdopterin converting factor small subunit
MTVTQSITVKVRPFSGLVHALGGQKLLNVELPADATVEILKAALLMRYPILDTLQSTYVVAVGEEIQETAHPLRDGDTVDLIPPIAGG